ncbi:hypothetical protein [Methylomonas fluvii]|uniref:Uncharacterized protein n=1 Tax=Methylomonas fluvii TaxID=1854564 RepID=A0ABR9DHZ0_9GAMM|nr:hypothetical protein [Methylomonas fluvii]MBD9362716.1 hypothetical protein [Methylomonas fluvii]
MQKKSIFYTFAAIVLMLAYHEPRAVTMGASNPTFTRLLYKGHPSMPTTPNTSIVNSALSAGATYTLSAASSFKGAFTPVNVGMTLGTTLIAYGMMTALNELRVQAGVNVPQYTPPESSVSPTGTPTYQDSYNWSSSNICGNRGAYTTATGTTAAVCSEINTKIAWCYSVNGWGSYTGTLTATSQGQCGGSGSYTLNYKGTAPSAACPAGYNFVSGSCVLQTVDSVPYPSDGKPSWNIKFGGDGNPVFVPDPRDPDVATDPPVLEQVGQDQYGNPVSERVTPNKNGGITIRRETQSEHPTTHQPIVQADTIATDSFGTVVQSTSTVYDNSQVTNVSNNIDTSMLAQEATLQQINDKLGEATEPDLTNIDQPVTDARAAFVAGISGSQTTLDSNPAASVSPVAYWTYASGSCYPLEWDAGRFGKVSLSNFCSIYDTYIKPLEIWVLGVFGMLHAWQIWRTTVSVI